MRASRLGKKDVLSFYFDSLQLQLCCILIIRYFLISRGYGVLCLSFFFFVDAMAFQLLNPLLLYLDILSTTILFHRARLSGTRTCPSNSIAPQDSILFFLVTLALLVPYFCLCSVVGMFVNSMHRKMHSTSFSCFLRQFLLLCTKTVPLICFLSLYMASFFNVPQTSNNESVDTDELLISLFAFMGVILYYGVTRGLVNFDATMAATCSQSGRVLPSESNISTLLVQQLGYSLYKQPDFSLIRMLKLTYSDISAVLCNVIRYISNCTTGGAYSRIIYILVSLLHKVKQSKHVLNMLFIQALGIGLIGSALLLVPTILSLTFSLSSDVYNLSLPWLVHVLSQGMNLEVIVAFLLSFGLDYVLVQFLYSLYVAIFPTSALLVLSRLGFWFRILEIIKITNIIPLYLNHSRLYTILPVFIRMQLCSITLSRFIVITIQYKLMSDHIFVNIITNTHKRLARHRAIYGSSGLHQLDLEAVHLPRALRAAGACDMGSCIPSANSNTSTRYIVLLSTFLRLFYSNLSGNWGHSLRQQLQSDLAQTSDSCSRPLDLPSTFLTSNIPLFVIEAEKFIRVYQVEVNDNSMIQLYRHILEYQESCLTCVDSLFLVKSTLETVAMFFYNTVRALLGRVVLSDKTKHTNDDNTTCARQIISYRPLISAITSSSSATDTHCGVPGYTGTGIDGNTLYKKDGSTRESGVSHSYLSYQRVRRSAKSSLVHTAKDYSISDPYLTEQMIGSTRASTTLKRGEGCILRSLGRVKVHPFQVTPRLIHKFTDICPQNSELASLQTPLMNIDFLDPFDGSRESIDQQVLEESSSLSVTGQKLLEYQQLERALHDLPCNTSSIDSLSLSGGEVGKNSSSELNIPSVVQGTNMTFPIPFSRQCSFNDTPTSSCSTPISTPIFFLSSINPSLPNRSPCFSAGRKYKLKELEVLNYLAVDDNAALMNPLKDRTLYFALLDDLEKVLSTAFFDWVFIVGFTISNDYPEAVYLEVIERASKAQFMLQYAWMANSTIRVLPKLFLSPLPSSLGITLLIARCRKDQSPLSHVIQCDVSLNIGPSSTTSLNASQISDSIISTSIANITILDHQRLLLLCKTMQVFVITSERLQNHYKVHKLASMMYTRKKREKSQYLSYIMHCLNCATVFHSISMRVMAHSQIFSQKQRRLLVSLHRFAELNVYNLEVILSIIRFKTINLDGFTKRIQNCILSSHDVSITLASKGSSWNLFDILDRVLVEQNLALVGDLQPVYTIASPTRRWRAPGSCSIQAYSLLCPHSAQYSNERIDTGKQSTAELINYVLYTNVQMNYNFKLAFLIISSLHRYLYAHVVDIHVSDGLGEDTDAGINNEVVYGSPEVIARYQYVSNDFDLKQSGRKDSAQSSIAFADAPLTSLLTNYLTVEFIIQKIPPQLYNVFAVAICNCWAALCSDMPYIYLQKALGSYLSRQCKDTPLVTHRARSCPAVGNSIGAAINLDSTKLQNNACAQSSWCETAHLLDANKILSHILALKALLFEQCSFFIDDVSIHLRVHMKRTGDPGLSTLMLPDTDSCASSIHGEQGVMVTPPHFADRRPHQHRVIEAPRLTADLNHEGTAGQVRRMYPNLLDSVGDDASKSEVSHGYADVQPSIVSTKFGFILLHRLPLVILFTEPKRVLQAVHSAGMSLNMELLQCASEEELSYDVCSMYVLCQLNTTNDPPDNMPKHDKVLLTFKGFLPQTGKEEGSTYPAVFKSVTTRTSFYSFCTALGSLFKDFLVVAQTAVN